MTQASLSPAPNRMALLCIAITTFLGAMGIGLINPIAPYLVAHYVTDPAALGLNLGWLTSIYALCQFVAAPGLGVLSDRFGRRPILLICLLGSAVGYLLLGVGGALWVLFLGRVIDGLTGANFSVGFAYIADVTAPNQRGKYFGLIGAIAGVGTILGPTIGGLLAHFGYSIPLYFAAAITFGNVLFGLWFMPESLRADERFARVTWAHLNPFGILATILAMPQIRWILLAILLYSLPFAALLSNIALYAKDSLQWEAATVGSLFALVGVTTIVVQGLLLQWLLRQLGELKVAAVGLVIEIAGYLLIASVLAFPMPGLMFAGVLVFAAGDGLLEPSLGGLLSRSVTRRDQGRVQGGNQSIQAIARIGGPLIGGAVYDQIGHAVPYLSGAVILIGTLVIVGLTIPMGKPVSEAGSSAA